jgi:hypothetical protein
MEFTIWIREEKGSAWGNGNGAMPVFTATRIVKKFVIYVPLAAPLGAVMALLSLAIEFLGAPGSARAGAEPPPAYTRTANTLMSRLRDWIVFLREM